MPKVEYNQFCDDIISTLIYNICMLAIEYRYFYQSALDSSIRKASQNLNINSSAIVRQIQKLEDRLQTKLFIRNARGLELTNEGKLLFIEPLGTNPLINFYRVLTPKSRSKDEHPLVFKDFEMIKSSFKNVNIKYYGFLTLVFFPFYSSNDSKIFKFLLKLDQLLFKTKIFRYFAWSVLITAKKN